MRTLLYSGKVSSTWKLCSTPHTCSTSQSNHKSFCLQISLGPPRHAENFRAASRNNARGLADDLHFVQRLLGAAVRGIAEADVVVKRSVRDMRASILSRVPTFRASKTLTFRAPGVSPTDGCLETSSEQLSWGRTAAFLQSLHLR